MQGNAYFSRRTKWAKNRHILQAVLVALVLLSGGGVQSAYAQGVGGTVTGTVADQSNAVIPNANVSLTEGGTGALRKTVSNDSGFFTISSVPAGTYSLIVAAQGFAKWERTGVVVHPGDRINISDITLNVAAQVQEVKVEATPDVVIPVDSGEKSEVIQSKQIQNLSIIGRNAVELLKILPGVVNTGYTGETVAFNQGVGSYNVAGTRSDALDIVSDGANVIDPGCNCGSAVTANVDLVQEVKVQVSNMSAENTKGPVVIQTVSKSGTKDFHGEAYAYLRHYKFNSADWQNNRYDTGKPASKYLFPGFNIGGPLTKSREKAFFFAGFEWQRQQVDLGTSSNLATVPTAEMRNGNFSDTAYLSQLNGYDVNAMPKNVCERLIDPNNMTPYNDCMAGTNVPWEPIATTPEMLSGGVVDPSAIDPGGKILLNLYPLPNRDPAKNNGFNYISSIVNPQHRTQQLVRIDYNFSDNLKLYTRFNHEHETEPYPYTLWWNDANQVPTPSRVIGQNRSYSTSTSLVHVLSPTTTNEIVFAATYLNLPNRYENPEKVSKKALGYPYRGIFKNEVDVIPNITDWSGGVATMLQPGGFDPELFANKWLISAADNFSKVYKTHFFKFGAFFQITTNDQPTSTDDVGDLQPTTWGGNSTGNAYADLLMGRIGAYAETTKNLVGYMRQREFSGYVQDNWKVTRRWTLELGARFYHYGWMYDKNGYIAGFDLNKYDPTAPISDYTGIVAAYKGDSIPRSGFKTPALRIGPRFGFAYDLTGKGNTVIRGGFGQFLYRDQGNVYFGAIGNPPLQRNINLGWNAGTLASLDQIDPTKNVPRSNLHVLDFNDDRVPTTYSWSLTLSHRLPYATVLEASYVGNTSRNQVTSDGNNINLVPAGAMLGYPQRDKDGKPITDGNAYRPISSYGAINMATHILNQHYHSLQVTANRQTGRVNYSLAYTYGKVLGIGGGYYIRGMDPYDRRGRSYGVLDYDRTHTLSVAYNLLLPDPAKNAILQHFVNGWQISGITQFQSGGPIEQEGRKFNISGQMPGVAPLDLGFKDADGNEVYSNANQGISAQNVLGTPDGKLPFTLLCDPREGLDKSVSGNFTGGQFANPACFGAPTPGGSLTYVYPYVKTPGFMNHDISVFKNFSLSHNNENLKLQFRASAFNIINHPVPVFNGGDPGLALHFCSDAEVNDAKNKPPCFGGDVGSLDPTSQANFGRPINKAGHRIIQFALKFFF